MRTIDADALKLDLIAKGFFPAIVKRAIENAPTIESEPQKHGRWEEKPITYYDPHADESWDDFFYEHKACGYQGDFKFNYCPDCGAKMNLEDT